MKIFLVGEGPTDCGQKQFDDKKRKYTWLDGPVQVYIHKVHPDAKILAMDKTTLTEESAKRRNKRNQRAMKGLSGHGLKAFHIAGMAIEYGCDVAAMYVDADKAKGPAAKSVGECQKRYNEVCGDVKKGLLQGGAKQCLAIVPMKMIECWLMGDPAAFSAAFGKTPDPALLKTPELIWGDEHDPDSDYPKNRLARVMKQCSTECCRENYSLIAEHSRMEELTKGCPISFGDFKAQLDAIT